MKAPAVVMKLEATGKVLTDVLRKAWVNGFSIQSNFARVHAPHVAMAASRGLITTRIDRNQYGHRWLITPKGLSRVWAYRR